MGNGNLIGEQEQATVHGSVARLQARGVDRRAALRRVARNQGGTVRYVRTVLDETRGGAA